MKRGSVRAGAAPRGTGARGSTRSARHRIHEAFTESAELLGAVYAAEGTRIERLAGLIADTALRGGTVFWAGNGGSAAEAQHFAAELVCRFLRTRRALPSIALHADTSSLTAVGNDFGFERVFARPLEALGRRGDLLVAMSTSGRSRNVLAAIAEARRRGMRVAGMTGARGRAFAGRCDVCVVVPSEDTARIQEVHLLVGHLCCELAEARAAARTGRRPAAARARSRTPRGRTSR